MADNLPRPWPEGPSPAPWSIDPHDDESVIDAAGSGFVARCENPEVARLVRSLPDWIALADERIRRMDAVREWCDEILAQCAEAESRGEVLEMPHRILKAAAQHVLARLDGGGVE